MTESISARVPEAVGRDIDFFTKQEHTDRSTFVRKLLTEAIAEKKVDYALKKYQEKEITIGKAAEMARIPLRKMIQIAADKGIPFQYSAKDLEKDIKAATL
ncbi:UPF0175 family protein [Candidatus Woesearchaeota archaeon]|nr:UPF0175 family protein [Candidatus Woesearchaeota archaeon]